MRPVSILCTQPKSHYLAVVGPEKCYDAVRDMRTFAGDDAVVCHPPCAQWGGLRALATDDPATKALGPLCVEIVRRNGGILEHPRGSTLWAHSGLPRPGEPRDEWGGWTIEVDQSWWGFPCRKRTWLYLVRTPLPQCPLDLREPELRVDTPRSDKGREATAVRHLPKSRRSETVPALCRWLVDLAGESTLCAG